MFLISNMIYLYGLIQPMAGRNRVKLALENVRSNKKWSQKMAPKIDQKIVKIIAQKVI